MKNYGFRISEFLFVVEKFSDPEKVFLILRYWSD
jgi:hypothetical protein